MKEKSEIKTMDELRAEACTEDEVTFRNARSKVSAFMKKAGLSIEASEVSTMSRAMNPWQPSLVQRMQHWKGVLRNPTE